VSGKIRPLADSSDCGLNRLYSSERYIPIRLKGVTLNAMTDLFKADFNALSNDEAYAAIAAFADAQPNESNRHDFKLVWTHDAVTHVAAFANTFGGLLVVGVDKGKNATQAVLAGVTSTSEIMTGIASAIATNISPTPSYDIMECYKPGETNKRFCVVRVRSDSILYLVTKKGSPPVWIRNADQTISADAAQLRRLIDRERQAEQNTSERVISQAGKIADEMFIGYNYPEGPNWSVSGWNRSDNYLKLAVLPAERRLIPLDVCQEDKFVRLVHHQYQRISRCLGTNVAYDARNRDADFFEYRWYHAKLKYEQRWRTTDDLVVAHATQLNEDSKWSLLDVVMYSILLLKIAAQWWTSFNYFGDGIFFADISVSGLQLARGNANEFTKLFGPGQGDYGMREGVLQVSTQQRNEAQAYVPLNSATLLDNIPRTVTSLLNPLLRRLGHAVAWAEFEENVRIIAQGQP
jgi:hypothetical protein